MEYQMKEEKAEPVSLDTVQTQSLQTEIGHGLVDFVREIAKVDKSPLPEGYSSKTHFKTPDGRVVEYTEDDQPGTITGNLFDKEF
jgi:hypothetical protein